MGPKTGNQPRAAGRLTRSRRDVEKNLRCGPRVHRLGLAPSDDPIPVVNICPCAIGGGAGAPIASAQ